MKAFVIEDEVPARRSLIRKLTAGFPDITIAGEAGSVREAIAWLQVNRPDIIFMDVELSDGDCFEIFRQLDITAKVIMTTAYDNYAVKAFEAGSVDYLLKPVDTAALHRAVDRCRDAAGSQDIGKLLAALQPGPAYKERFLVFINDHIVPVRTTEVACFYAEDKNNHVVTRDGTVYVVDASLDDLYGELDPALFFRISRGCIVAKDLIESVLRLPGGRLQLSLPAAVQARDADFTVSRSRTDDFLKWLES